MKILIIGASGLVGQVATKLLSGKHEVHGTYNSHTLKVGNRLDVTIGENVSKQIGQIRPDVVLDTHSLLADYCELHKEEAWNVNVMGTKNVVEASKSVGATYIFISSDYIFDGEKRIYGEDAAPTPLNYYGFTKAIAESMIQSSYASVIIARTSFIYGLQNKGFVNFIASNLREGKMVDVISDEYGSPTLAHNLVEIIIDLAESRHYGVFNIAGKDCISRYDFAKEIAVQFGLDEKLLTPVSHTNIARSARRALKVRFDTSKVESASTVKLVGVKDGLKAMLKAEIK